MVAGTARLSANNKSAYICDSLSPTANENWLHKASA